MKRELNGVLVVDKAPGMSSAAIVARTKRLLEAKKAGHTGTLDPFAEGLMVLCFGKATRLARFFLHGEKTYEARLRLGIETDTQDSTGQATVVREVGKISRSDISKAMEKFKGTIRQLPPVYSALKHKGEPLYKLARKGKPVQKPAREVSIYEIEIIDVQLPEIQFRVTCSGGAYIRTLAADIGNELGCGGHLDRLKRVRCGGFGIDEAVSLEELEKRIEKSLDDQKNLEEMLIPLAEALRYLSEFTAPGEIAKKIVDGVELNSADLTRMGEPAPPFAESIEKQRGQVESFKIVDAHGELLAVASYDNQQNKYKYCCVFPG